MATAARLLGQLQTIDINSSGQAAQPDVILADGQSDTLNFKNLAPFPVKIQFICANGPVFNDILRIDRGGAQSSALSPQKDNITVNYRIINLNTNQPTGGPYGVQVGSGSTPAPMLIPIKAGYPYPAADYSTISVPSNSLLPPAGWIQFNLDQAYTIVWDPPAPANTFDTPTPPNQVDPNKAYQAQVGNQVLTAQYTLTSVNIKEVVGHGTVHINS